MRIAAFVAALIAIGLPLSVQAETAKPAKGKAVKSAKPAADSHLTLLMAAAARGEAEAQHQLGLAYRDGHGVKTDHHAALSWLVLSAVNGNALAALDVSAAYERGQGVGRDTVAAGQWLYRAGVLGNAEARTRWTEMVLAGKIASLGGQDGAAWIAAAAAAGDARAPMILAEAFDKGLGVAPNDDAVEGWLRVAIALYGDVEAQFRLGRLLLARQGFWRMPTEEEWSLKDAERKGLPFGAVLYAAKPAGGDEKISLVRPGMVEGERRLEAAARAGHAEAQYHLGSALVTGIDLPLNMAAGIVWLEAAAAQGHAEATMALGGHAAKGDGLFVKDPVRAFVLYDLAASAGEEGAAAARDAIAKTLNARQSARARLIVQGFREIQGL
ncbi:sel1 repeat family protein [Paramagnetospirillum kuznetsovii]|uniref:Sel1 repeat family protein n=1 Tax=Paramagnetospirillum kuznetsovii TaxID=2053833 RepID=A0A364P100_9PROT|nr:tetratricopeptide repeat protein [Paramagnetospirillum kuznetsovii]RAU22976.1 sel1 repeat family protein [Paramagnetospirillum kuznetsovii]